MTARQFKNALERVGSTQAAFARLLGITPRHVNKWASGDSPVPRYAQIILTLWAAGKISEDDL